MSDDDANARDELFPELLDDFFAESDEHLSIIRKCLLTLEARQAGEEVEPVVDELFRSFHTLKGISGMVGLSASEQLAHSTEGFLRAVRKRTASLTVEGIEALFESASMLELTIAARRTGGDAPDIAPAVLRLDALAGEAVADVRDAGEAGSEREAEPPSRPEAGGARRYRVEFTPAPELAGRGINVDSIRARLQTIGRLIHAAPVVRARGEIAFEFLVETADDASSFAGWSDDGLVVSPVEPEPAEIPADVERAALPSRAPTATLLAPSNVVRVDLQRLDDLMRVVGELVIDRTRLAECVRRLEGSLPPADWRPLQETSAAMERSLRELRESILRVRMVPIGEIFDRMQFVVRDLAREYRKKARLELSGRETEIDKYLVERMMDPLLHLVRNAISHGLDAPDEREARGKPPEGRITLSATTSGETVELAIEDDGRGIDLDLVTARARAAGIIPDGTRINVASALDVLCAPGFSTRSEADRGSGRGVGMDVVRRTVHELGGTISVDTAHGRGTRFTIRLPLTLSIADALIVAVGDERFAVPQSSVREVLEVEPSSVRALEKNEVVPYRGTALPLLRLARLFSLEERRGPTLHTMVVGEGASAIGIAVDRILGLREIVVRSVRDPLVRVPGIAGATELGDGRAILILDVAALTARSMQPRGNGDARPSQEPTYAQRSPERR